MAPSGFGRTIMFISHLLFIAALVHSSLGAIETDSARLKSIYDFIIVGGGTAGLVVANRLTEDPRVSVLVLEAGVTNEGVFASQVPFLAVALTPNTPFDWNYTTTPQPGLGGRGIAYPRGRMLGGSSSVNFMIYQHGSIEDFNRYASHTGDPGWKWDNIKKYIFKSEKLVPPADNHDTTGQFTPSVHGTNGAVSVSLPGHPTPLDQRVIATTQEMAAEFPFNQDMNSGDMLGIGWTQATIGGGTRSSSATAYLTPALNRPNLDVLINAHVTKLVQTGTKNGKPSFHTVQYTAGPGAPLKLALALKEVILSAGSVSTPAILLRSGIGDRTDLEALNIRSIVHNPSVGRNLTDHVLLTNGFQVNSTETYDNVFQDPAVLNALVAQWVATKTGPAAGALSNHLGWLRLPANASIFSTVRDPSAGPKSSHWEILFSNLFLTPNPLPGNFMGISTNLISPTSRGFVKLASSNPFTAPTIDPNFLSTPFDIFTMKEAIKAIKRLVTAHAWDGYVIGPVPALVATTTDAALEAYIRANAGTSFHPTGTAAMSPKGAKWGVVDPNLKVKGVEGVRVVDASILPFSPNAHTQGPTYLVGERGADLIKADW